MAGSGDILIKFGERVRQLRKDKGYSQEAFADACKLDRSYVGGVERGERNISLKNIEQISIGLDVSLNHLLDTL